MIFHERHTPCAITRFSPGQPKTLMVVLLIVAAFIFVPSVFACSGTLPSIEEMTSAAEIIAIGTFIDATDANIVLQVETYLKGTFTPHTLLLNNHHFLNSDSCQISLVDGPRFINGTSVVVFLQRDEFDVGTEWRPTGPLANYVLTIRDETVFYGQISLGSLTDVKARITTLTKPQPAEQGILASQDDIAPSRSDTSWTGITIKLFAVGIIVVMVLFGTTHWLRSNRKKRQ